MTYTGDNKLSEDIQQRVEGTYQQSRDLAAEGKVQEAKLGCEFVLRLDPLYEPARELMQKLEAGESVPEPKPNLDDGSDVVDGAVTPAESAEPDFDLAGEFTDLLDRRDFHTLLNLAKEHRSAVDASPELTQLAVAATERLEAEPYVREFLDKAEKAQREGRQDEALALLEKIRVLDSSHPSVPAQTTQPVVNESNARIRELLEEGQSALERGDHQGAIDSWSRIFLIDIDHGEANRRIEDARRLKAEGERKVEEAFHEGVSLWELGSADKAREQFDLVLGLNPNHSGAKDYIERMDAGTADAPEMPEFESNAALSPDAEIFAPPDAAPPSQAAPMNDGIDEQFEVAEAFEPGEGAEAPSPQRKPAKRKGAPAVNKRFLMIAGLAVSVVAVVGAGLYMNWDRFFPNSDETQPSGQPDALGQARTLNASGQTAMAIGRLKQLPTNHPQYAEAQALIAQWEEPEEVVPEGPEHSDEQLAERDGLVLQARAARDERLYLRASTFYDQAAKLAPLSDEDLLLQTEVGQRLAGLEPQIDMYEEGDWEFVLPELWRLHMANPDDRDVVDLMVNSYYNLGVRDLQRGDIVDALEKYKRALELNPGDTEVERLLAFSQTYSDRPADLLYKVFVKYLPYR